MKLQHGLLLGAGSTLVVCFAIATLAALNLLGGWLAPWLGLARGGTWRLAWDLAWLATSCGVALWAVARWAPAARRALAWLLWLLLSAAAVWAVVNLGGDFPGWFRAGVLLMVPALWGWLRWLLRPQTPPRA